MGPHQSAQQGQEARRVQLVVVEAEATERGQGGRGEEVLQLGQDARVESHALQVERLQAQCGRACEALEELG